VTSGITSPSETDALAGVPIDRIESAKSIQRVLLLAADDDARRTLHLMLDRAGKQVAAMSELAAARRYLSASECDVVIATPDFARALAASRALAADQESLLSSEPPPHSIAPAIPPIVAIVRPRDLSISLSLLDAGIDEVIGEPVDELGVTLALRHVAVLPRRVVPTVIASASLIGDGEAMQRLRATIEQVAKTRSTVLILGESGTGKELVARSIHDSSPRRNRRFVAINCAAIPAALLESELFGHVKGAFTDAVRDKTGLFEDADGGSLFLDEVGELPQPLQAKLLRALQEGEIRRVGDTQSIKIDVRLIAATLRDLSEDVAQGRFREDLYYRLNVLPVKLPALRERVDDIPQLARFFLARHAQRHNLPTPELSDDVLEALCRQPWPGNVRELENALERAIVLADWPTIDLALEGAAPETDELSIKKATRELEQDLIKRALVVTGGNRTNAAKLLEISHRALLYKLKEYGIS
jgi:two-component system response regulator AtoC